MKPYPSIPRYKDINNKYKNIKIYAFDKLDGSNIRAEWTRKQGFWKFGKRKGLVGQDDPMLGSAQQLFMDKYNDYLDKIFKAQRWQKATAFCEFHGPSSFAGVHSPNEAHTVTMFDINVNGMINPKQYMKLFGHLDIARLLYKGYIDNAFIKSIEQSILNGMTFEGVVCKGAMRGRQVMFKLKSNAWIDRVKSLYIGNELKELL